MSADIKKTRIVAYTAVLIALLVGLQFVTRAFGQLITGGCVNLVLAVAVLCCGLASGLTVAVLSPFFAFLLGIGPAFIQIVPFIALANAVYVLLISFVSRAGKRDKSGNLRRRHYAAVAAASVCKFAVLYLLAAKLVIPSLGLPDAKMAVISASFSWPQLVTAFIGGLLAAEVSPLIRKAMR